MSQRAIAKFLPPDDRAWVVKSHLNSIDFLQSGGCRRAFAAARFADAGISGT